MIDGAGNYRAHRYYNYGKFPKVTGFLLLFFYSAAIAVSHVKCNINF